MSNVSKISNSGNWFFEIQKLKEAEKRANAPSWNLNISDIKNQYFQRALQKADNNKDDKIDINEAVIAAKNISKTPRITTEKFTGKTELDAIAYLDMIAKKTDNYPQQITKWEVAQTSRDGNLQLRSRFTRDPQFIDNTASDFHTVALCFTPETFANMEYGKDYTSDLSKEQINKLLDKQTNLPQKKPYFVSEIFNNTKMKIMNYGSIDISREKNTFIKDILQRSDKNNSGRIESAEVLDAAHKISDFLKGYWTPEFIGKTEKEASAYIAEIQTDSYKYPNKFDQWKVSKDDRRAHGFTMWKFSSTGRNDNSKPQVLNTCFSLSHFARMEYGKDYVSDLSEREIYQAMFKHYKPRPIPADLILITNSNYKKILPEMLAEDYQTDNFYKKYKYTSRENTVYRAPNSNDLCITVNLYRDPKPTGYDIIRNCGGVNGPFTKKDFLKMEYGKDYISDLSKEEIRKILNNR